MNELKAIISAYEDAKRRQQNCVLATVVHVEGSAYRRAGARMLVDEDGKMTGAISGGCLEGDALRKALHALYQNQNKLITYDTSDEADAVIGAQLGCNGVIQVLFEPLDYNSSENPLELLKKTVNSDHPLILVSLFNLDKSKSQFGTVGLFDRNQLIAGQIQNEDLLTRLKEDIKAVYEKQCSQFIAYSGKEENINAFLFFHLPAPHLVIVGAGNDAQVLSQMADTLGWKINVVDGRPSHANIDRFIGSCQVLVSQPEEILDELEINNRTLFVLMTHNYHYDFSVFKILLSYPEIPYIGILGPMKKYQRMLDDLNQEDIEMTDQDSKRVYAPIGLDLGGENPAEISLSILAEIQSVLSQSRVMHLREKEGPIHNKKQNEFKEVSL